MIDLATIHWILGAVSAITATAFLISYLKMREHSQHLKIQMSDIKTLLDEYDQRLYNRSLYGNDPLRIVNYRLVISFGINSTDPEFADERDIMAWATINEIQLTKVTAGSKWYYEFASEGDLMAFKIAFPEYNH